MVYTPTPIGLETAFTTPRSRLLQTADWSRSRALEPPSRHEDRDRVICGLDYSEILVSTMPRSGPRLRRDPGLDYGEILSSTTARSSPRLRREPGLDYAEILASTTPRSWPELR